MAGHSKWANIKHKKAAQDKKRGKLFTKLLKELMVAAKVGGPDVDANPRLRAAVTAAKKQSVPKDNIEKAIKKATGGDGEDYKEIAFEGYGPDGIAIYVEAATDNHQRTLSNVRSYFTKFGGSLGKDGCLQFIFDRKAIFSFKLEEAFPQGNFDEEEFTLELIDAGAEDVEVEEGIVTVSGAMEDFGSLQKALEAMKIESDDSGLKMIPTNYKEVSEKTFSTCMKLIDKLEDDDDVQEVYHNIELTDELMSAFVD